MAEIKIIPQPFYIVLLPGRLNTLLGNKLDILTDESGRDLDHGRLSRLLLPRNSSMISGWKPMIHDCNFTVNVSVFV